MTSRTENTSNDDKVMPGPSSADLEAQSHVKKGTLQIPSWRKHASQKSNVTPPSKGGLAVPVPARPSPPKRTASSTPLVIRPSTSIQLPLKDQISLLCIYVTENNAEKANFVMDGLARDDLLESAGFTTQDASGNGLLQIASLNGHLEILTILLDRGININAVDRNHGTALQAAIYMGHEAVYRELLEWPEKKPAEDQKDASRQLPRNPQDSGQSKVTTQTKRLGITKGKLDVNTKGGYYGCALQVAAYRANSEVVNKLIDEGAEVNISGGKYGYPLQAAVRTGSMDIVRPILSQVGIDVNTKGGRYGSALQAVARGGYGARMALPEISRGQVLKQFATNSDGKLVARVNKDPKVEGYVIIAAELLDKGALLDGGSGTLDNPINAASCSGSKEMLKLMLDNFKDKTKRSETWDEKDSDVLTKALLTAITHSPKNQKDLVELLVQRGAQLQYPPSATLPNLPLEAAATKNLLEVVKYLLKTTDTFGKYADTLAVSGIHGTALRAAIAGAALNPDHEDVAACLLDNIAEQWGRKPSSPIETGTAGGGLSTEPGELSSQKPIRRDTGNKELDWTIRDAEYGNLLQLATFSGLKRTVSLLLEYGADPNVLDTSQRTSLHIAAWSGFPQIVELLLNKDLPKRADATLKDEWGATPLDQAEESLDREGHPGATAVDLQRVIQILRGEMGGTDSEKPGMEFHGPKRNLLVVGRETKATPEPVLAKPVFSMPYWVPGVGFRATIIDFWEADNQECLLLKKPRIEEILYHKAVLDGIMTPPGEPEERENKLRWIHLPTNNMTWAEMLITSICQDKKMPAYKSLWGTDPFYTSSDLSPHARFIAPQCGRLVRDGPNIQGIPVQQDPRKQHSPEGPEAQPPLNPSERPLSGHSHAQNTDLEPNPLFLAMPYLHWEAHLAQKKLGKMIAEVKDEAMKTTRTQKSKTPLWPDEKGGNESVRAPPPSDAGLVTSTDKTGTKDPTLETPENEEDYRELLRRYLYKRRPVHLRRTLDQYYYSYLADTNDRDGDQVVMRQFNEDKKSLNLEADTKYQRLWEEKKELQEFEKQSIPKPETMNDQLPDEQDDTQSASELTASRRMSENSSRVAERNQVGTENAAQLPPKVTVWEHIVNKVIAPWKRKELKEVDSKLHKIDQVLYYDDNSPVLMIDQLWLWIIDKETIVTCFPHRQYGRNAQDLDAMDQTDVLKTIVSYLHSSRRPEINTSHALAELIISQCVGVLHKADMIPDLDFLKKYSVQSNKWADQVMRMLSKFVSEFENFMIWIKEQPAESEESIRWFESIFSVTEQTQLLRNIQDIKDELGMLKAVFDDQIQVLTPASEHIEQADFQCMHGSTMEVAAMQTSLKCAHSSKTFVDQSLKHLKLVKRMQFQANQAYDTLKDLLNLKQQQAYVLEARVNRNEAISSGEQSKTILVFTIVTIIFLPLTFVTTVFTLPIAEFHRVVLPEGSDFPPTPFLRKSYIVKYILILTFTVAAPLILAAFEIQSLQNGWKKLRLKIAERSKAKKLKGVKREDDGMPEFLKRGEVKRA